MIKEQQQGQALPFITFSERSGFTLTKEAEEFLKSLDDSELGVISIVGKYRTGKSFFINRVLLEKQSSGFGVGPTINPCTKGLWLWNQTLKSENPDHEKMKVLLIDTEGFAGIDENTNHDTRIFLFSLLLSSYFIYNSVGNIDETALQNLSLIVNLAKEIQLKASGKESDQEEMAQYFPSFLWIVRDFALKLIDHSGNSINSKEYLESALQPQKGLSDNVESKNRTRRLLKHFFRERDCCTMIRPLESEKELQKLDELPNDMLRPEFNEQTKKLRKKIFKLVKPKTLMGKPLNGSMLLELTKAYLLAINSGGVPNIENAWTYLCKQESQKAIEDSLTHVERRIGEKLKAEALSDAEMKELKSQLREEMLAHFKKKSLGSGEEIKGMIEEVEKQFMERYKGFKQINKTKWSKVLETWIFQNSKLQEKLKNEGFKNYFEFHHEMEKLRENYLKNAPSAINKAEYWKEFALKIYQQAAETLSRNIEGQYDSQVKRLTQRLEMTENDLEKRKKDFESEKEHFYQKLHEIEKDKAIYKAQDGNIREKLETLKAEKEKFERLYNETREQVRSSQDLAHKEAGTRIRELETTLEALRSDNFSKTSKYDMNVALLEQELQFIKKESLNLRDKGEKLEIEKARLHEDNKKKESKIEELKAKVSDIEVAKQAEVAQLRIQLEKKILDLQSEAEKRKDNSKEKAEWLNEKMYLTNQITFLKSQLDENKRLHDALILALEQNMHNKEDETTTELRETNKNLSAAVDKMEERCKHLEEKVESLKQYKKMFKNCKALQCIHCSKYIACTIFAQHTTDCLNGQTPQQQQNQSQNMVESVLKQYQSGYQQKLFDPTQLQIIINQTMVKESADSKPYTEYLIQISYFTKRWSVARKYKTFCELHQKLNTEFPSIKFPDSSYIILGALNSVNYLSNSKRPTVIEERRKALQQYLRDLSKIDKIAESIYFQQFLDLDKNLEYQGGEQMPMPMPSVSVNGGLFKQALARTEVSNDSLSKEFRQAPESAVRSSKQYDDVTESQDKFKDSSRTEKVQRSQSPGSFLKMWQEKQQGKENTGVKKRESKQLNNLLKKSPEFEMDGRKIDNIDVSNISGEVQEYPGYDVSHNNSILQHLKSEGLPTSNNTSAFGPSSPFSNYFNEKLFAQNNNSHRLKYQNTDQSNGKAAHLRYANYGDNSNNEI